MGKYNGQDVEVFELVIPEKDKNNRIKLMIDIDKNLPIAAELESMDSEGIITSSRKVRFEYPQNAPKDIYDVGVPRTAQVVNWPVIKGRLVDKNGFPVHGTVTLNFETAKSDEQGMFAIDEPLYGPMDSHIGYAFDREKELARGFFWKKSDDSSDLEIVLEPLAAIVGRVVDKDGNGDGNAKVEIWIATPGGGWANRTDNPWNRKMEVNGKFSLEGVPVGFPMDVHVEKPGFQGRTTVEGLEPGEKVHVGDIRLKPLPGFEDGQLDWTGVLSGRVVNEKDEPMSGLNIHTSIGTKIFEDITDAKGQYTLAGLPKGKKIHGSVYLEGYGHTGFDVIVDGNDFDIQILPQGYQWYGKEAPGLFVEKWLNTEPITLEQYRGKVIMLQLAVLLPTYSLHLAKTKGLIRKYGDKGLEVIAVHQRLSVTWAGSVTEEDIVAFIENNNIEFPFGIDDLSEKVRNMVPNKRLRGNGATHSLYGVKVTPGLYLIDKKGRVQTSPTSKNIDEWIKKLLAE